ncbi:MAG: IS1634 family transposase [Fibrobacter sp.]|nr:IS1634 family transposase [Fibrobacter sp.]
MHFISEIRYNAATGCDQKYYRIKESFRDALGKVRCRIMLNVGFLSEPLDPHDIAAIGRGLTYKYEHRNDPEDLFGSPFSEMKPIVCKYIEKYWDMMVEAGTIDAADKMLKESKEKARGLIDSDTMKHRDVREMGAEWLCLQAIRQLKIEEFLISQDWSAANIKAAVSCLITRAVNPSSELRSIDVMRENSAACELVYGDQGLYPSQKTVYKIPDMLYGIKDKLENYLCRQTDNLFNQQNRILIFDLTNTFYESSKRSSKKAKYGRSKEKRSDCKLLVLALCVNSAGFIRYSSILPGNTADPDSLPDMIENVIAKSEIADAPGNRAMVIIDAGIATEANLKAIREKGYNYMCVSRSRLTHVELKKDAESVIVHDTLGRAITLKQVERQENGDYFLQVNSPTKALTESSMIKQWCSRFETELQKAKDGIHKKGGTKNYEKVVERVGRAMGRYPSVAKYYTVTYERSKTDEKNMADLTWKINEPDKVEASSGIYYLRTNVLNLDEKTCWDFYNTIRDVEATNRQIKNDLSIRPIFHQKDERADAHLFFGLLAYWIVNTIRYQLKQTGEYCYWTEIVRRMNTQKVLTTEAKNGLGEKVTIRQCSEPNAPAAAIYKALNYMDRPFRQKKICSTLDENSKNKNINTQRNT